MDSHFVYLQKIKYFYVYAALSDIDLDYLRFMVFPPKDKKK